jgi:hypothetical protein
LRFTLNAGGLISGAFLSEQDKIIVLCGYNNLLQPFIYLLYDYSGNNFFSGNKRKISIPLPFHQVEGIASNNRIKYYISNEHFTQPPVINVLQKLHILDLNAYLGNYINNLSTVTEETGQFQLPFVYPNPAIDVIKVKFSNENINYLLTNTIGQVVMFGTLEKPGQEIDVSALKKGMYFLILTDNYPSAIKVVRN